MNNPFINKETNEIEFPYLPLRDLVFIWPEPLPEGFGTIIIPEKYRVNFANSTGVVVAVGKGHYDQKTGKFIPNPIKVGDWCCYDEGIPWSMEAVGHDGGKHIVRYCGVKDLQGVWRDE